MSKSGYSDNLQSVIRKAVKLSFYKNETFNVPVFGTHFEVAMVNNEVAYIRNLDTQNVLDGLRFEQFKAIVQEVASEYATLTLTEQDKTDIQLTIETMMYYLSPNEIDNDNSINVVYLTLEDNTPIRLGWSTYTNGRLPRLTIGVDKSAGEDLSFQGQIKTLQLEMQLEGLVVQANMDYLRSYVSRHKTQELTWEDCQRLFEMGYFCVLVADSAQVTMDGNDRPEVIYLVEIFSKTEDVSSSCCIMPRAEWMQFKVLRSRRL